MSKFQQIATAPYWKHVEVKVGRRWFLAMKVANGSLDENERPCDQWQALTDNHPACWSDGACWESNADGNMSAQPEAWRKPALKENDRG